MRYQPKYKIGGGCDGQPPLGTMNLLSVNCRGCGLRQLVEEKRPVVVFLMETRMGEECSLGLEQNLGFPNTIIVKSEGLSGGLMLLWRWGCGGRGVVQIKVTY